jgi:hypothetical protein
MMPPPAMSCGSTPFSGLSRKSLYLCTVLHFFTAGRTCHVLPERDAGANMGGLVESDSDGGSGSKDQVDMETPENYRKQKHKAQEFSKVPIVCALCTRCRWRMLRRRRRCRRGRSRTQRLIGGNFRGRRRRRRHTGHTRFFFCRAGRARTLWFADAVSLHKRDSLGGGDHPTKQCKQR